MATRIRLADIAFDAGTQIRAALDQQVVSDYAEAMTNGATFPPIVLFHDGNQHYLADGFHRFMAAQRLSFRDIEADVRPGTKEDALWFALGANGRHGKRLGERDVRHAVELAIRTWPERSGKQIAEQVGCSQSRVSALKERMRATASPTDTLPDRVIGKDGRSYPASLPKERPVVHPKRSEVAAMVGDGKSSRDICDALHVRAELVADVRREMGVARAGQSRDAVKDRHAKIEAMADAGYSSRQIAAEIRVTEYCVRDVARKLDIDIPADRVVGKSRRHDANRIVERIVMDAENLTEGVNLVEFSHLDRDRLGEWADSLIASRRALDAFIKRLVKEQQKHGEAA